MGRFATLQALAETDVVLKSFGAYGPGYFRLFAAAKALRKRTALFWIGTDVVHATTSHRGWASAIQRVVDLNLAVTEELGGELGRIGARAEVVPIVSDLTGIRVEPLPVSQAVLCYLPPVEHLFYGSEIVRDLARRLPDTPFLVVGGWQDPAPPPNLECLGFVDDMAPIYGRTSVLLRMTPHDGLPKMLLEALAFGRHVIWSHPFPHCRHARSPEEALDGLRALRFQTAANIDGAAYVQKRYSFASFAALLAQQVRELRKRG
jgi:hypothetical protein